MYRVLPLPRQVPVGGGRSSDHGQVEIIGLAQ